MWESGYYPPGAEFDSLAPWNEKKSEYEVCPDCNGKGYEYLITDVEGEDEGEVEVSKEEYYTYPSTKEEAIKCHTRYYQFCINTCQTCYGDGRLEKEEYADDDDYYEEYLLRRDGYI